MEYVLLGVAAANTGFMAAWLTIAALDNVCHPFLNEKYAAQVMDMERMREEYPEAYEHVANRRLANSNAQKWFYWFIVFWELLAMATLWVGVLALVLAMFSLISPQTALTVALMGATLFISIWAGFLVAGNYFCYWFGHEGGQNTHFHMLHWGLGSILVIVAMIAIFTQS
ncbi:MAG: DUF2165 family protein [Roseovarius sp.]|nr:DUF2165 family protein [Roseovarius sp.]